jgi:plastocyanin
MRTFVTTTALAIALTVTAAACASDSSTSGAGGYGGGTATSVSPNAVTPTASSTDGGGRYGYGGGGGSGGSGSGGSGGGGPVAGSVVAADYAFTPSNVQVKAGATITVQNSTPQTPHTFTVKGTPIDLALDPQSSQKVTIDLAPGTYEFYCRFHVSLGMKGTLIVN